MRTVARQADCPTCKHIKIYENAKIFLYCQSADRGCTSFSRSIEMMFRTQNHVYSINIQRCWYHIQARSQGGVGGVVRPPPVAHPKDFVPPFSNFVPPFSNFVPPFSNFVPPFSNFVPPFSNFVPPLEYVDDVTRAMSKGGVLVNVQEWGRFSN